LARATNVGGWTKGKIQKWKLCTRLQPLPTLRSWELASAIRVTRFKKRVPLERGGKKKGILKRKEKNWKQITPKRSKSLNRPTKVGVGVGGGKEIVKQPSFEGGYRFPGK